jgi:hypothetical protein
MLKVPEKGSITWLELFPDVSEREDFRGVSVGIKHVGPKVARRWTYQGLKFRTSEARRVSKLRDGTTKESAPELWEDLLTPEGAEESADMVDEVLAECIEGVRGADEAILEYLDFGEGLSLMNKAIGGQTLKPSQTFRSKDSSNVDP